MTANQATENLQSRIPNEGQNTYQLTWMFLIRNKELAATANGK